MRGGEVLVPVVTMYIAIKHFPTTKWTDRADLSTAGVILRKKLKRGQTP